MTEETKTGAKPETAKGISKSEVLKTVLWLVLVSFLVGAAFSIIGLSPVEFWSGLWNGLRRFIENILNLGWDVVFNVLNYVMLGAIVVVPIWGVSKLISMRK